MSLSLITENALVPYIRDVYSTPKSWDKVLVELDCPSKQRSIKAFLAGSISFQGTSDWHTYFGSASTLFDTLSGFDQLFRGKSLKQPWMGRQYWTGSQSLTLNISLQFVSFEDAKCCIGGC